MNAYAWNQLSWKDKYHWIYFKNLHSFKRKRNEDDENENENVKQRKEDFFREEIFLELIKSIQI
jgi:hypothetical protein